MVRPVLGAIHIGPFEGPESRIIDHHIHAIKNETHIEFFGNVGNVIHGNVIHGNVIQGHAIQGDFVQSNINLPAPHKPGVPDFSEFDNIDVNESLPPTNLLSVRTSPSGVVMEVQGAETLPPLGSNRSDGKDSGGLRAEVMRLALENEQLKQTIVGLEQRHADFAKRVFQRLFALENPPAKSQNFHHSRRLSV
ncbi:hypothetical protein BDZ91DRAFT_728750 [Kalaharituber pfeilii]|nr:hypothetical protein BDZ91DRAFT_728750 [Kalaharituber pfeilii]